MRCVLPVLISIHALLAESDPTTCTSPRSGHVFLSTLSLRRATTSNVVIRESTYISIHALLAESDRGWCFISAFPQTFLSTLSLRRATGGDASDPNGATISIHALLAESDNETVFALLYEPDISIHALLAESDRHTAGHGKQCHISIHALLAESDWPTWRRTPGRAPFLSTLSLRRATNCKMEMGVTMQFLSTLSLRRATCGERIVDYSRIISIHALLAESDRMGHSSMYTKRRFLSTLSLRRATPRRGGQASASANFYPRSPCGERPGGSGTAHCSTGDFYPRSPCGERQQNTKHPPWYMVFLSTLSLRRATDLRRHVAAG